MSSVALFKALNDAECMEIVVKTETVTLKTIVERALASVSKRGMTNGTTILP